MIPILFIFSVIIFGCIEDDVDCENAELCVKNIGTDTIYYCWGCNYYEDFIIPRGEACTNVGEISIDYSISGTTESVIWINFDSSHGSYLIRVDDCYVEKFIE